MISKGRTLVFLAILIVWTLLNYGCNRKTIPAVSVSPALNENEELNYTYAFMEANRLKLLGNIEQATVLFQECLKMKPSSSASYYELSNIYGFVGQKRDAIDYAIKACSLEPDNNWYLLHLANLYNAYGIKDSTILVYEKIVKKTPDRIDYQLNLAALYNQSGRLRDALKIYEQIETITGVSEEVTLAKERIYYQMGKTDMAINELEKLISSFPEEIQYYGMLAEVYSEMNEDAKANSVYQELFSRDADNGLALLSYSEFLRKQGKYEEDFKYLERAYGNPQLELESKIESCLSYLTNNDEFTRYRTQIEHALNILYQNYGDNVRTKTLYADFLLRTERKEDAKKALLDILKVEKSNLLVWEELIFIFNDENAYSEMISYADQALEVFPDEEQLYLYKSVAESQMKEYNKAIITADRGLLKVKNNNAVKIQLMSIQAEAYHELKEYGKSDALFDEIIALDPGNTIALNNYAYYLSLRSVNLEKALGFSKKCIDKEPSNSTYLDTYAWILYKMDQTENALNYIHEAIKYGGNKDSDIMEHYGDIVFHSGNADQAVEIWKKALELNSNNEVLRQKIIERRLIEK
jgi:tetratricopeptide (TPR) repeat protein